jgi:hypothetical protein
LTIWENSADIVSLTALEKPAEVWISDDVWNGMVEGQELDGLRIMPTFIERVVDSSTVIRDKCCPEIFLSASIHERPC